MWMVDPGLMCDQHLLGEHAELHMFVGTIQRGIGVRGYLEGGLLEPRRLWERHEALVEEMGLRGFEHRSPLPKVDVTHLEEGCVHPSTSLADLRARCARCRVRSHARDQP